MKDKKSWQKVARNCALRRTVRTLGISLLLAAGAESLPAAQQLPPDGEASAPLVRVESRLVVLDVVVTDKAGNIVTGLGRDDFSVYEDGVEQTVNSFEAPQEKPALPLAAARDRYGRDDWGSAPRTILVIDAMNTPFAETAYCRDQVDRYLRAQPPLLAQPTIVLWLNDRGFHPITQYTRDRDQLIGAIAHHKTSIPDNYARGDLLKMFNESLAALQQIALSSQGQRGSKQIVWVGRSFPTIDGSLMSDHQIEAFHRALRSTINNLLESRTTVYVIDPTVQTGPVDQSAQVVTDPSQIETNAAAQQADNSPRANDPFAVSFDFKRLAAQTGGEYYVNRNDLHQEIGSSIAKATTFYSLSYIPSHPFADGDYRKIEVRSRNPQYVLHARQGYYPVSPLENPATAREMRFDLFEAMVTGMEYSGVALRIDRCALQQDRSEALCDVLVENGTLSPLSEANGFMRAEITTVIAALDAHSIPLANHVSRSGLKIPNPGADAKDLGLTRVQLHLAVPQHTQSIRIVVRDASGRIGTANVDPQKVAALIARK